MADRIIVLTHRPGRVRSIHKIELKNQDGSFASPLERRSNPKFTSYFNMIWKELDVHA